MWYVIIGRDGADALPLRRENRAAHLARMQAMRDAGRVLLAGPMPAIDAADPGSAGFIGSLLILEFDSLDAARTWTQGDPYVAAGVWGSVEVHPFVKVL